MMESQKNASVEELQRKNRRFGVIFAAVVAGIFVLTFAIAIFVHYMDVHHYGF